MEQTLNVPMKFPRQRLSMAKKTAKWRKECVDWGVYNLYRFSDTCRSTVEHKRINHDLINGILHMDDLESYVNPYNIEEKYNTNREPVQHFNLMLNKLNVLRGEESNRVFDYKVVVTNPNVISEIAENKKKELLQEVQRAVEDQNLDEQQFQEEIQKIQKYYTYTWQDIREVRGNAILNHYSKELDFKLLFNEGFMTALWSGEEIYRCYIKGGEPTIERVDPYKLTVLSSGYSNKIEDASMIIYNDYWPIEKVYDVFGDQLSEKDMKYLEDHMHDRDNDSDFDEYYDYSMRKSFAKATILSDSTIVTDDATGYFDTEYLADDMSFNQMPYDLAGNVRVTQVWWKSRKKLQKVKRYDPETGDPEFEIYTEAYIPDENMGEESEDLWTNQAWRGVKIGTSIYVDMGPCEVQYNKLSDPSACHFGFIGSVYNLNNDKPYTLVDMMKPYNYLYDVTFNKLLRILARNVGKAIRMDLAKIPQKDGWTVEKWMYFLKVHGVAVEDSFNEGDYGAATGKIAGGLNNATTGVVDAELGNTIASYIQILQYVEEQLSTVSGVSRQREGQISNRETVGGVERATLQSSHITEWLFLKHEDVKKRVIECFLETAKAAFRDKSNEKFQYIIPGWIQKIGDIDGDQFAECDYGIVVDNSKEVQQLSQKLDMLVQAGIQNQMLNFSTALQLYTSCSTAEKVNIIRNAEAEQQQIQQQQQQQQQQLAQQQMQQQMQQEQMRIDHETEMNTQDNETKIQVAVINAESHNTEISDDLDNLKLQMDYKTKERDLDLKLKQLEDNRELENKKLEAEDKRRKEDNRTKIEIARINARNRNNNKPNNK